MEWERYKRLCDQPDVLSRWMLEQTLELISTAEIAAALRETLAAPPLEKPNGHRGGEVTDMYVLKLSSTERETIAQQVRAARDAGIVTSATTQRGLGGFVEAWDEYVNWESRSDS